LYIGTSGLVGGAKAVPNPNYNGCTRWRRTAVDDAGASTICQVKSVATDSRPDKWDKPIELPHVEQWLKLLTN
jgi:hypothetical protein